MSRIWHVVVVLLMISAAPVPAQRAAAGALTNPHLRAEFGPRGPIPLVAGGHAYRFSNDDFSLSMDSRSIDSSALPAPSRSISTDAVTYA